MKKIATMMDISKLAGVSTSTVSHVINKTRYVSPKLVKKINKIIKELDYEPNYLAGSLRSKKTKTIGLIIPDSSNPFFGYMQKYIEDYVYPNDFSLIVSNSNYSIEKENKILGTLKSKKVEGILIVPENTKPEYLLEIQESGVNIVCIEREIIGSNLDTIIINNRKASYEITKYLIELGHRNICYVDRIIDKSHSLHRKEGYLKAMEDYNIEFNNEYILRSGFSCKDGYEAAKFFLNNVKKVTAILTFGDFAALGAIRYVNEIGLNVPKDVSIVGYSGYAISSYANPKITTIKYPAEEIAKISTKLLFKRINSKYSSKKRKRIILNPKIIIKESTGPPRIK